MIVKFRESEYPTIDDAVKKINLIYPDAEVHVSVLRPDADPREKKFWSGDSTVKEMCVYTDEWCESETGAKGKDVEVYITPATLIPFKA